MSDSMGKVRIPLPQLFDEFYAQLWGERWPGLRSALLLEPMKVPLINPFPEISEAYFLDAASLIPPRELNPQPGENILDLCAAPGGKSLALFFSTEGRLRLTVNELSRPRFQRLKAVLHDHLPANTMANVNFNCGDGARYALYHRDEFDGVLVDAPCSGERHLLISPESLKDWSTSRSKQLSVRQHSLLCAALDATRSGGRVVYSTCSISLRENDGVLKQLHKSREGKFKVRMSKDFAGEATEYGRIYLPDRGYGGPIYCAVVEKI